MSSGLDEVIPKSGLIFNEMRLHPVLCKPKLLPLKSVTLEKLEKMQKEAQEKVWEVEKLNEIKESANIEEGSKNVESMEFGAGEGEGVEGDNNNTDVWKQEDDTE